MIFDVYQAIRNYIKGDRKCTVKNLVNDLQRFVGINAKRFFFAFIGHLVASSAAGAGFAVGRLVPFPISYFMTSARLSSYYFVFAKCGVELLAGFVP